MADVNTKVSVSGSAEYKAKMGELASSAKNLDAETKALTSSFDKNTSAAEKNAAKQELLQRKIENQKEIVATLSDRYTELCLETDRLAEAAQKAAQEHGANSKEAKKAELQYAKFKAATNKVGAELNNAVAKLNTMESGMGEMGAATEGASGKLGTFGSVLAANLTGEAIKAGLTAVVGLFKQMSKWVSNLVLDSAAFADEILTLSSTTGMSTDALQEYKYMAELTDVSLETITGSQTKLIRSMSSAASGGKTASNAFAKIGVAVADADGNLRSVDAVFTDVLTALGGMGNETERDAVSMELFGKSARELNPLIEAGADAIEDFRREAHEMGYVLDEDQLSKLGKVDDGYQRIQKRIQGLKNSLGADLAPAAESVFDALERIIDQIDWDKLSAEISQNAEAFAAWVQNIDFDQVAADIRGLGEDLRVFGEALSVIGKILGVPFKLASGPSFDEMRTKMQESKDASAEMADAMEEDMARTTDAITSGFDEAGSQVEALGDQSPEWGADFVDGYTEGFRRRKPYLIQEVQSTAQEISAYLHFSRPDKGPLRDYEQWMPDFMAGLARTMEENQWRVEAASASAAAAMAAGIHINQQITASQARSGDQYGEIIDAIHGVGGDAQVTVVLEGDAKGIFKAVRTENNRIAGATGYNKLGRSRK